MKYLRAIIQDPESEMEMKSGAESTQKQEELQQQQQRHFHVLAVDDNLMDRKLLERQLLKVSSCHVTFVDSGNKALEYLGLMDDLSHVNASSPSSSSFSASSSSQSQPQQQQEQLLQEGIKVNLIITDYCMPGISGYDLLKRIKGSSWKDVPVVVMSSENIPSRISMCLEGGAEEFLLKPLQLSDVEKLQQHLSKPIGHPSGRIGDHFSVNDINSNDKNKKEIISTRLSMSPKSAEIAPK